MSFAGGRNAFADSPVTYPRISVEGVLRTDPDVIVDMGDMAETIGVSGVAGTDGIDELLHVGLM